MAFPIGFMAQHNEKKSSENTPAPVVPTPKKSLVRISFPGRGMAPTYFNDRFDLHKGDLVYVTGKLAGTLGRVVEVNYSFKIKPSDYQTVVAVVDREVHGRFHVIGSHCATFDPAVLPKSQVRSWFVPPAEPEEYITGDDGGAFYLADLSRMQITQAIADRGFAYYMENRVKYLCVHGEAGYAIVAGEKNYEVEFTYRAGEISGLTCTCPCGYTCKHSFAAMLQLQETLELIQKHYPEQADSEYLAAIFKGTLFQFVVDAMEQGDICL